MMPADTGPRLLEQSTTLRRFTPMDAAVFAAINHDPLNVEWAGSDPTMSVERAADLIAGPIAQGWSEGQRLRFAIEETDGHGSQIVGTVSLQDVAPLADGGTAEVGIKLLAPWRGRGVASRAVGLITQFAFEELGLSDLFWRSSVGNEASRALAERLGFVLVARIPAGGRRSGVLTDGWIFALNRHHSYVTKPAVPTLSDGAVVLRELRLADAKQLVLNCLDPAAVRWTTVPLDYTQKHAEHYIKTITPEGWAKETTQTFAVADAASDRLLGTIDLQRKSPGLAAIGINFGPEARGTGAAQRACRLIIDYAFAELHLSYLHWFAEGGNWASRKLAWKLGFRFEGEIRGGHDNRGTPCDLWILTLGAHDPRVPGSPWDGATAPKR